MQGTEVVVEYIEEVEEVEEIRTVDITKIDWESFQDGQFTRAHANAIIPESAQNRFMAAKDKMSEGQWEIADLALEMVDESPNIPKSIVDRACGLFAGLGKDRIADMRAVAEFYPVDQCHVCGSPLFRDKWAEENKVPHNWCDNCQEVTGDVRELYDHVCSFSHFFYAKAAKTLEKAKGYLEGVVRSMDDYNGQPMSVSVMRAKMTAQGDNTAPPVYIQQIRRQGPSLFSVAANDEVPVDLKMAIRDAIDLIRERVFSATQRKELPLDKSIAVMVLEAFSTGDDDELIKSLSKEEK